MSAENVTSQPAATEENLDTPLDSMASRNAQNTDPQADESEKDPPSSSGTPPRRPDYIMVVKEENLPNIELYLDNLHVLGLSTENEKGETVDMIFIKVYITEEALTHFSQMYEIGNFDSYVTSVFYTEPVYTTPFPNPIAHNVPFKEGELTEAEKILVVKRVMENAKFGPKDKEFGLSKLIQLKVIETAYPLHDGPITDGGTNSRSLLARYWSTTLVTHMQQPLDLIFRYYGHEVAFYFAWLEYFNIMLVIPAVLGCLTFLASLVYLVVDTPDEVREVCEGDVMICPNCEGPECNFKSIRMYCSLAHWTFAFDNNLTISFAVFISFWASLFITIWRRKESKLKLRWHCVNDVRETQIRPEYLDTATHQRQNQITGEMEPYTPTIRTVFQYTVTFTACGLLLCIIVSIVFLNMILKIFVVQLCDSSNNSYLESHSNLLTMMLASTVQVICVKIFETFYEPASIRLTHFENPRTQYDFDNSVLYKKYLLGFMNNYVPLIYLAFMKGQFVTLPHKMTFIRKDACQPCNCLVALCIQLAFLMTVKTLLGNVFSLLFPEIKRVFRTIRRTCFGTPKKNVETTVHLPQWEEEYYLEPLYRYSVTSEFSEMVIRFGYVTFFSKAFPVAAFCALLNNLIELRSDAYKFVKSHRRPVAITESGIGAWNGILLSLSYFGTAMNAFVMAFTSDWVPKEVYRLNEGKGSLKGYVLSMLSKYATVDHEGYQSIQNRSEFCYFRGFYYPPDSPQKYETTQRYWLNLTFKFVAVFVFEHIVLMCSTLIAYCIPHRPESVRLQQDLQQQKKKESRLRECEQELEHLQTNLDLTKSLHGLKH